MWVEVKQQDENLNVTKTGQLRHTAPLSVNMDALSTRVDIPTVVNVSVSPKPGPSKVRTSAPHCHGKHKPYAIRRPQRWLLNYRLQKPNVLTPLLMMRSPRCQIMLHRRDKLLLSCNYQAMLGLLTHYSLSVECIYLMFELWFILTSEPRYLFSNDIHFQCDTHWSSYSMT